MSVRIGILSRRWHGGALHGVHIARGQRGTHRRHRTGGREEWEVGRRRRDRVRVRVRGGEAEALAQAYVGEWARAVPP